MFKCLTNQISKQFKSTSCSVGIDLLYDTVPEIVHVNRIIKIVLILLNGR